MVLRECHLGFLDDYLIGNRVEPISESKASLAEVLTLLFFALLYAPFVVVDVLKRSQAESS